MTRSALAIALLLLAGCDSTTTPSAAPSFETNGEATVAPSAPSGPSAASTDPGTGAPPAVGGSSPSPKKTGSSPAATGTSTGGTGGPYVEYFRIKTKPSCPSSGPGGYFPGNGAVLEWKVTGGPSQVTISIDGPGLFGTYPAVYQYEFPFGCGGASGSMQKHTYLLTTVGSTKLQTQITIEARVN